MNKQKAVVRVEVLSRIDYTISTKPVALEVNAFKGSDT